MSRVWRAPPSRRPGRDGTTSRSARVTYPVSRGDAVEYGGGVPWDSKPDCADFKSGGWCPRPAGIDSCVSAALRKLHQCDFACEFAFDRAISGAFVLAKGETMAAYYIRDNRRSRRIVFIYSGAVSLAFVSGTCALVALLLGSPLEFGSALAICASGWIVAHIAERFAEQERTGRRLAVEPTRRTAPARSAPGYLRLSAPVQRHPQSPTRERILSTV